MKNISHVDTVWFLFVTHSRIKEIHKTVQIMLSYSQLAWGGRGVQRRQKALCYL